MLFLVIISMFGWHDQRYEINTHLALSIEGAIYKATYFWPQDRYTGSLDRDPLPLRFELRSDRHCKVSEDRKELASGQSAMAEQIQLNAEGGGMLHVCSLQIL